MDSMVWHVCLFTLNTGDIVGEMSLCGSFLSKYLKSNCFQRNFHKIIFNMIQQNFIKVLDQTHPCTSYWA